jgi:hypothetical protein
LLPLDFEEQLQQHPHDRNSSEQEKNKTAGFKRNDKPGERVENGREEGLE